ncbi:PIN domain-containing protein [Sedimenticola hydrogenitrophicus]|uniref:PIN domain-containing protein n=1 Tax=Sedimenticola hydrogenitrophicus TaxID=2967975 RepID=UPI0021A6A3F4|nr:PIN domain-containing protein [Sedimenticola hydrogenitrophicus]
MAFVVLLDANVLYPAPLRDFLITLATSGLYSAKWTERIYDEWWTRNLVKQWPELKSALSRTRELMDRAVPDCLVTGYESLIEGLALPDPNDRHVLAAAIRCGAQIIVTHNLKDFPADVLDLYGVEAMLPDEFLEYQFGLRPELIIKAAKAQRARLQNPPKTPEEFLERLAAQGLVVTAEKLDDFKELI